MNDSNPSSSSQKTETSEPKGSLTKAQRKELLSPPAVSLPPPTQAVSFADETIPLLQRLQSNDGSDSLEWYRLALQSERFRLESRLHRLLSTQQLEQPYAWSHLLESVRKIVRNFHGRALLCHEPGLGSPLGLALALTEYVRRGVVSRTLLVAPGELLGYWATLLHTLVGQPFVVADRWPAARPYPEHLLLPWEALEETLDNERLEGEPYPLIAVAEAGPLRKRRSQPWRNLLTLSPRYLFLQTPLPLQTQPAEVHGMLALLGVPELPPAARLRRQLGGADAPISPATRQELRPFLSQVTLRNTPTTSDLIWPERQWKAPTFSLHSGFSQLCSEIKTWLRDITPSPVAEESAEAFRGSPAVALLAPLLLATHGTAAALHAALEKLQGHDLLREHASALRSWLESADKLRAKDPRLALIQASLQENPRARFLIVSRHAATRALLQERLAEFLPEPNSQAQVLLATDRDVPIIQGAIDFLVQVEAPWHLNLLDQRAHWMLHPEHGTRQIRVLLPEDSSEKRWWDALQMRFKPASLAPEELTQMDALLAPEWRGTGLLWHLLHHPDPDAFFEDLSKEYLNTRKLYRQLHDKNQRLFLDDYAL